MKGRDRIRPYPCGDDISHDKRGGGGGRRGGRKVAGGEERESRIALLSIPTDSFRKKRREGEKEGKRKDLN